MADALCANLRSCTVHDGLGVHHDMPTERLATAAARVFLSHGAHLKSRLLASKLQRIIFLITVRSEEQVELVYHKTWDQRMGISVQSLQRLPAEAAYCPWRLGVRVRTYPFIMTTFMPPRIDDWGYVATGAAAAVVPARSPCVDGNPEIVAESRRRNIQTYCLSQRLTRGTWRSDYAAGLRIRGLPLSSVSLCSYHQVITAPMHPYQYASPT